MYDYLLVGAGLFNAVFANEARKKGKHCLVIERRSHIGGNCYTEVDDEIVIHKYGAHIFRTSNKNIWNYIQQFAEFNHFINSPIAKYYDEVYNMPFNMNTFSKMWGISTPQEAMDIIEKQSGNKSIQAQNLEEHAIQLVGTDIYQKLIKGYTEKQWGRACSELPASIMRRIPLRFTYDNNYFTDPYQGIPIGGYTPIIEKLFEGNDIEYNVDYNNVKDIYSKKADRIIYTGTIDAYYNYEFGSLKYRSLRFETEKLPMKNYQGVAVVNYTDRDIPYTRIIEHKHFEFGTQSNTIISREYPLEWVREIEPYYPISDKVNELRYKRYSELAEKENNVFFGGRLGEYRYYDMQDTIKSALGLSKTIIN